MKIKSFPFNHILIFILLSISLSVKAINIHEIKEDITDKTGNINYKKVSFESDEKTLNHYFKYNVKNIPKSRIGAFRIDFDVFNKLSLEKNEVYCAFVEETKKDDDLVKELEKINSESSNCIGQFNNRGIFEGIIKYDQTKTKLGIILKAKGEIKFTATVYIQTTEQILEAKEQIKIVEETFSLVPFTINISDFRSLTSNILLYSNKKELQIFYEEKDTYYPKKLFSGNIMSIYTAQNMVHQKYHDANLMVLLTRGFSQEEDVSSENQFQIIFPNNYLLDYFVSNNPNGRSKNSPLAINMTECGSPYFFILNYNKPEKEASLYIDQIYGKIKSLSISTNFTSNTWDDMIKNDMHNIEVYHRKFILPMESNIHMDIYRLECEIPLLLNFYYVDETADIPPLDYGQVAITTLKPYQIISFPFNSGVSKPKLTIEIFHRLGYPLVNLNDGENEIIINKNYLIEYNSSSTENSIIIKEKGGEYDTRIIIKVGYNIESWSKTEYDNLYYNSNLNMYVYSFPNDEKKLNYTYVNLTTIGVGDNVKYCFGTNIGSAIIPSDENCYRVSKDNEYLLKFLNPFVMHKDYEIEANLVYYISIKPVVSTEEMKILPRLNEYNINERNLEGVGNNIMIGSSGKSNTILSSPKNNDNSIFVQIQNCNLKPLSISFLNAYNNQTILQKMSIPEGEKKFYKIFNNTLFETELLIEGVSGNNIFVKHTGFNYNYYSFNLKNSQNISFNPNLNQLEIESPIDNYEEIKYIIFIDKAGELSKKDITLCSFAEKQDISIYNITLTSYSKKISVNINLNKFKLKPKDPFEVLVYSEQQLNSKMVFLSEIISFTVGEIKTDIITEINTTYIEDEDYVYTEDSLTSDRISYYYSFLPETKETNDVPLGAFSIELDSDKEKIFSGVYCALVDEDDDEKSMIDAIQAVVESYNSYCTGGKSQTSGNIYNYIFKYTYKNNRPRKLVIKLVNGNSFSNINFTIYIRKGENPYLKSSDEEYGNQEENKKSVIPYIVDLEKIRGTSETDYISKILIYSQYFEMQMYYLDEKDVTKAPIKLFTGNIMLLYTKLALAKEKYSSTKLILLSEYILGQKNVSSDYQFRFHTKMFKSDFQIEYYTLGSYISYPISLEINTCTKSNSKSYFLINYNKVGDGELTLYLDILFGSMKKARIINELSSNKWDTLIGNMVDIDNYQISLENKVNPIDIIEIECNTPLLANVYYNNDNYEHTFMQSGEFVIKSLKPHKSESFTLYVDSFSIFYYSISLFNPVENPEITIIYNNIGEERFNENALHSGYLVNIPENITIVNNGNTSTRFIYKIGYGVESEWIDEKKNIEGKLYSKNKKYVYKFPNDDNKKNFTSVLISLKPMKTGTQESQNLKFCYSVSMGTPIDVSYDNCVRTGDNMPYSLTFINPLILPKNYNSYSNDYYITLSPPYYPYEYISVEIQENKYNIINRNIEGIANVINMGNKENSTILSIPEMAINTDSILLQMQLCSSSASSISYEIINSFTDEEIEKNTLTKDRLFTKYIDNTLFENELKFIGNSNDKIFTKHIGLTNYELELQDYRAEFIKDENAVDIYIPIMNENFNITILVGEKGTLKDISLCDLVGKSESQYKEFAKYVKTIQTKKNKISHYIDFSSFNYKEKDKFDLLVYAVQIENSKLEILYDVISGEVESIQKKVEKIEDKIDNNYYNLTFIKEPTSNYLFYEFEESPIGNVSSFRIKEEEVENGIEISEVGCIFVDKEKDDENMISLVSKGMEEGKSNCIGGYNKDSREYNGLINTMDVKNGKTKLVIKIIYDLNDNQNEKEELKETLISLNIILRINGQKIDNPNSQYKEDEKLTLVPYILDLNEIRGKDETNYISKVLLFSKTHEMNIFYLDNGAPVELFFGNILVIYTNPELVKEKYNGATTMILLTETFSETKKISEEEEKFKVYFFKSEDTIQYFLSGNPKGRPLNNPTSIEMKFCDQPYYYILNYHSCEGNRILHLENIFGEINTIKIATEIKDNNWEDFIKNLKSFEGQKDYNIEGQNNYHFDVLEVTCKTPLLLNVYYTDPSAPKEELLDKGDVRILSLNPWNTETLTFKPQIEEGFIYIFNVLKTNSNTSPNIIITFNKDDYMQINKFGIFTKKTKENYPSIKIQNMEANNIIKIIFKFGYIIDKTFTKIDNDVYNLQKDNRKENLFAYIFKNGEDRLNYTSVDFTVSTNEENVKFCYTTNLGAFIMPSLQNCYRVGNSNSYKLSILNPYIMYNNYYTSEDIMDYYISFKTVDSEQNITITPNFEKYSTNNRNNEGYPNTIKILNNEGKTLLTKPSNNEKYLLVQMDICSPNKSIEYEFYNAYYNSKLEEKGIIKANTKNNFRVIENTNFDTLLAFENPENKGNLEVFTKHIGINEKYQATINEINISFDKNDDSMFYFNQPIKGEEFNYTIYIDKKDYLLKQNYNLCDFTKLYKLAHYSETITSNQENITKKLDFNNPLLKGYEEYDVLILAENGKLMILSNVFSRKSSDKDNENEEEEKDDKSNLGFILGITIPLVVIILIIVIIFIRQYKKKKNDIEELMNEDKEMSLPMKEM